MSQAAEKDTLPIELHGPELGVRLREEAFRRQPNAQNSRQGLVVLGRKGSRGQDHQVGLHGHRFAQGNVRHGHPQ